MPRLKDPLSLIIGTLWEPREDNIYRLRNNYPELIHCELFTRIRQSIPNINQSQHPIPIPDTTIEKIDDQIESQIAIEASTNQELKPKLISKHVIIKEATGLIDSWEQVVSLASTCEDCKLCYGRTHVVIERGNRKAPWMFIGEGPGKEEDLLGKPFVGPSGQLLNKMIQAMNLDSEAGVYVTNVVKCRPPHNRNPEEEEIAACSKYLFSQIELVKPKIIVTLGRYAAQTILKTDLALAKLRNNIHFYQDIPVIVTYHPSYLLRTPTAKKDAWVDLQLAMRTFNK